MSLYFQDNLERLYHGDCRNMSELPDESVQMCVTSPPYWGLRKYAGVPDLIWGGENHHEHEWVTAVRTGEIYDTKTGGSGSAKRASGKVLNVSVATNTCSLCGAWKGSFGLEPSPEMYVQHSIEILREIRRVLRKDGVCFWNVGDSYASSPAGNKSPSGFSQKRPSRQGKMEEYNTRPKDMAGLKPKDLCLIPERVALAAQADGWWVRSIIVWAKPNPMPESVTDRPTDAYEHILMLTKSERYFWDAEAVREKAVYGENLPSFRGDGQYTNNRSYDNSADYHAHTAGIERPKTENRNLRNVWTFPTQPYRGAHFATFPEELPERCIKAATSEKGCCSKCGKPWVRILKRTGHVNKREDAHCPNNCPTKTDSTGWAPVTVGTSDWKPQCDCNADVVPCTVLDPFAGSGTTLWVAKKLGRRAIGYELSSKYVDLCVDRTRQEAMEI